MDETKKLGMAVMFIYIGIAIALIVTVVSSFVTAFNVIDYLIPSDTLSWYWYHEHIFDVLSVSVSFLIVAFGVLFYLSRRVRLLIGGQFGETIFYKICHGIILFVLTLSFLAVAISSVMLLSGLLGGDISLSYLFKLLFVAGVGGMVFFYYRGVLRGMWRTHRTEEVTMISICAALIFVIAVTTIVILNPLERRAMDETFETLEMIESLTGDIDSYYEKVKYLPMDPSNRAFVNHESVYREYYWEQHIGERFTYKRSNNLAYTICAEFDAVPSEKAKKADGYPYEQFEITEEGETCFDLSVQ